MRYSDSGCTVSDSNGGHRTVPFPYPKIIARAIASNGGDGTAVSLPQNNIVGKRQCRLLISDNINSDANEFDISPVSKLK
jgi:hypothetical protein